MKSLSEKLHEARIRKSLLVAVGMKEVNVGLSPGFNLTLEEKKVLADKLNKIHAVYNDWIKEVLEIVTREPLMLTVPLKEEEVKPS